MVKKKNILVEKFQLFIMSIVLLFITIKAIMLSSDVISKYLVNVDIRTFAGLITLFIFFIFYSKFTYTSLLNTAIITSIFSAIAFSIDYNGIMLVNQNINSATFVNNFQNGLMVPMLFFGIYFFISSIFKA